MEDSQNKNNDINKKPISATRNTIADVENIIVGVLGGVFFFGLAIFAVASLNIFLSLVGISLTIMCIAEVFRGLASLNNKKLIATNDNSQNQMSNNDKRIKLCNRIKVVSLLLAIVFLILCLCF